jgi:Protein of unknown function (DUF2793)
MLSQLTLSQVDAYKSVNYNSAITQAWLSTVGSIPTYVVTPPITPVLGRSYLVGAGATGSFTGAGGMIATYFLNPSNGLLTPDFLSPDIGVTVAGYVKTATDWLLSASNIYTDVDLNLDTLPTGISYFNKSNATAQITFTTSTLTSGSGLLVSPFVVPTGLTVISKVGVNCYIT